MILFLLFLRLVQPINRCLDHVPILEVEVGREEEVAHGCLCLAEVLIDLRRRVGGWVGGLSEVGF